jgi:hypothetical protein
LRAPLGFGAGYDRLLKIEPMVFADFSVLAVAHYVDTAQNVVVTFGEVRRESATSALPSHKISERRVDRKCLHRAYTNPRR